MSFAVPSLPEGGLDSPMAHESPVSPGEPCSAERPPEAVSIAGPHSAPQRLDPVHSLSSAQFEKQPPDNMRKSNFFHFIISLYDSRQRPVQVQKAIFREFYDTTLEEQEFRNGLIYTLSLIYNDGTLAEEDLYIRLIDSATKQLIPYEGTCKNPDFRRVLLTHELICSRCLEHRSCGNKNDTPSDPIILDSYRLKIFAKCNQNCLKNAGNPKDSRRRFQVALYPADILQGPPIATSDSMFVHNNSKHGRRPIYRDTVVGDGKPCVVGVYPSEGWTTGNTRITVIGVNFFEGLDVVFGTVPVQSEVLSPSAIAVRSPPATMPGEVDLTLIFRATGAQFCVTNPGKFIYTAPDEQSFENSFCRIERIVRHQDDPEDLPKDIILQRAAELLEGFFPVVRGQSNMHTQLYPRSPALFGNLPGVFLTPQPLTPRINSNANTLFPPGEANGPYGYIHPFGGSNDHILARGPQNYHPQSITAFPFPDMHMPEGSVAEIKTETSRLGSPPSGIHRSSHPSTGHMIVPFISVPHMGDSMTFGGTFQSIPLSHTQSSNSNNNNSTTGDSSTSSMAGGGSGTGGGSSLSYISRLFPGGVPSSPGLLMASSFSPLPLTPTGGGSTFNFGMPLLSPTKSGGRAAKVTRPTPLNLNGGETSQPSGGVGLALPSPQLGSFNFPPITPTALIAPLTLPDLNNSDSNAADAQSDKSGSSYLHTPSRKRRADGSPVDV